MRSTIRRCRGLSLLETIVSFTILALISFMVTDVVVVAFRSQKANSDKTEARRFAAVALSRMKKEFMTTRSLTNPNPNVGSDGWWTPVPASRLVFHRNQAGATIETHYWLDAENREVRRWKSGDPAEGRVVIRSVDSFEFWQSPSPDTRLMKARVRVAGMTGPVSVEGRALIL